MGKRFFDFLELAPRSAKPRKSGLTVISDAFTEPCIVKDTLAAFGDYVDLAKITVGSLLADEQVIRKKIELYRKHDVDVEPAGPIFNIAHYQGKEEQLFKALKTYGFTHVEIDTGEEVRFKDGRQDIEEEASYTAMAKDLGLEVVGEVGRKFPQGDRTRSSDGSINVEETIKEIKRFLEAGADKVYWESRVTKAALGDYADNEEGARQILEVANAVGPENILFEVTQMLPYDTRMNLRFWFVRNFGPEVNIANTKLDEVGILECIRRGIWPVFGGKRTSSSVLWMQSLAKHGGKAPNEWWKQN